MLRCAVEHLLQCSSPLAGSCLAASICDIRGMLPGLAQVGDLLTLLPSPVGHDPLTRTDP
ncbi:hypothetical protein K402DRAFT_393610 [Aulographum hederae CBS 113979]|uniref:Uncharacterized protein n=1 Tax=Aulographum hederae CBS 113979 TaxID=1176131 RepID=A0A6G1H0F6_9PEZI|nr:hypothetical protein K402DRAFT_393610 [Aulographum hederae CBS 113979]